MGTSVRRAREAVPISPIGHRSKSTYVIRIKKTVRHHGRNQTLFVSRYDGIAASLPPVEFFADRAFHDFDDAHGIRKTGPRGRHGEPIVMVGTSLRGVDQCSDIGPSEVSDIRT